MVLDVARESIKFATIEVRGARVPFLEVGVGENVLLVPGWSLSPRIYAESARRLACLGFRIVVPELYGSSAKVDLGGGVEALAELVSEFARGVFGVEKFHLVGHSLGGAISMALGASNPESISKLVLVNSIGDPSWIDRSGSPSYLAKRSLNDWAGAFIVDMKRTRERNRYVPQVVIESLSEFGRNPGRVIRCALMARGVDMRPEIAKLAGAGLPILVLWTKDDVVVPRESFLGLAEGLGASRVELEGSHGWIFTSSEQFSALVGEFLLT